MTVDELLKYYGSATAASKDLSVTPQAINGWRSQGYIPFNTQYRIQVMTYGLLVADREDPSSRGHSK